MPGQNILSMTYYLYHHQKRANMEIAAWFYFAIACLCQALASGENAMLVMPTRLPEAFCLSQD